MKTAHCEEREMEREETSGRTQCAPTGKLDIRTLGLPQVPFRADGKVFQIPVIFISRKDSGLDE